MTRNRHTRPLLSLLLGSIVWAAVAGVWAADPTLVVKSTEDFAVTGDGSAPIWQSLPWTVMPIRPNAHHRYETRFKVAYSKQGLYVLMDGTDSQLTATFKQDFENLWTEDVFEFFIWPDERDSVYFEYEISPLNFELPILIPNFEGQFLGWRPWHYEGERRTKKAVAIRGGESRSGATIGGWTAEVFMPYVLLSPLRNVPPQPGSRWRANFYRVDYDGKQSSQWDWARVGESFHEYQKFGTLVFE